MKRVIICFCLLACLLSIPSYGIVTKVKFILEADETVLTVGQGTTVRVSGYVENGISGVGFDTWQMDIAVNQGGIIEIKDTGGMDDPDPTINLLAPDPDFDMKSGWNESSVNAVNSGNVSEVTVGQVNANAPSDTGIGGYTELFNFEIMALAEGVVTYYLLDNGNGFFAFLTDDSEYDVDFGNLSFDQDASSNVITVIPEPATLLLLGAGFIFLIKRRKV